MCYCSIDFNKPSVTQRLSGGIGEMPLPGSPCYAKLLSVS